MLVTPTLHLPPVALGTISTHTMTLEQLDGAMLAFCPLTGAFNATGQPAPDAALAL